MKNLFNDVFSIDGIHGLLIISKDGKIEFNQFKPPLLEKMNGKNFETFIKESMNIEILTKRFEIVNELLLIYGQKRIYIKNTKTGFLFIFLDIFVPIAMVRLNCQLIIPEIDKIKSPKGLGRFFRK